MNATPALDAASAEFEWVDGWSVARMFEGEFSPTFFWQALARFACRSGPPDLGVL